MCTSVGKLAGFCLLHCCIFIKLNLTEAALSAKVICNGIPGLLPKQKKFCTQWPEAIVAISYGHQMSRTECQEQFRNSRWNCTTIGDEADLNHLALVASKESAFLYAISSAGIAHSVTQFCSRGNLNSCGCDFPKETVKTTSVIWKWGGCSANLRYGLRLAKRFTDGRELEGDAKSLMNLHNNKVGRQAVSKNMMITCKCHGVSGSCSLKTCWRSLPSFHLVGNYLKQRYQHAKYVEPMTSKGKRNTKVAYLRLKQKNKIGAIPKKVDLVYIEPSPNYCEADAKLGFPGTKGRVCNRTSKDQDGCDFLCCGRGYNTHVWTTEWQCRCRFHWCCYVECDTCADKKDVHTCK